MCLYIITSTDPYETSITLIEPYNNLYRRSEIGKMVVFTLNENKWQNTLEI